MAESLLSQHEPFWGAVMSLELSQHKQETLSKSLFSLPLAVADPLPFSASENKAGHQQSGVWGLCWEKQRQEITFAVVSCRLRVSGCGERALPIPGDGCAGGIPCPGMDARGDPCPGMDAGGVDPCPALLPAGTARL